MSDGGRTVGRCAHAQNGPVMQEHAVAQHAVVEIAALILSEAQHAPAELAAPALPAAPDAAADSRGRTTAGRSASR